MTVSLYHPVKRGSIIALYQHWIVGIYAMISLLRHSWAKAPGANTPAHRHSHEAGGCRQFAPKTNNPVLWSQVARCKTTTSDRTQNQERCLQLRFTTLICWGSSELRHLSGANLNIRRRTTTSRCAIDSVMFRAIQLSLMDSHHYGLR
jgi:hypothetical protein